MNDKEINLKPVRECLWFILSFGVSIYVFIWGVSWVGNVVIYAFVPESYRSFSRGFVGLWGGFWHRAAPIIGLIGGLFIACFVWKVMSEFARPFFGLKPKSVEVNLDAFRTLKDSF